MKETASKIQRFENGFEFKLPDDQGRIVFVWDSTERKPAVYRVLNGLNPDFSVNIDQYPDISLIESLARRARRNFAGDKFTLALNAELRRKKVEDKNKS